MLRDAWPWRYLCLLLETVFKIQAPVSAAFNTQCCDMKGPESFMRIHHLTAFPFMTTLPVYGTRKLQLPIVFLLGVCGAVGRERRGVDFRWRRNRVSIGSSNCAGTADLFEPCPRQLGNRAGLGCNRADGSGSTNAFMKYTKKKTCCLGQSQTASPGKASMVVPFLPHHLLQGGGAEHFHTLHEKL